MTDFITPQQVAVALGIDSTDDATLALATAAASTQVRNWCGRDFTAVTASTVASARYYNPTDWYCVRIDDCTTVTAVATDDAANGNYSTAWSASDYVVTPLDGVSPAGQIGWPYTAIVAVLNRTFQQTTYSRRPFVKVTAKWGWSAVPDPVAQATLFLASEMFKAAREAPFGTANLVDFGPVTIRGNRRIEQLLQPYRTIDAGDGRFLVA